MTMTSAPDLPTDVRCLTDLFSLWEGVQSIVVDTPASGPCLWLAFLDPDGERRPALVALEGVPDAPGVDEAAALRAVLAEVDDLVDLRQVASLLERGGDRAVSDDDRAWAECLGEVGLTSRWPLHIAVRGRVRMLAADDLVGARPAEAS